MTDDGRISEAIEAMIRRRAERIAAGNERRARAAILERLPRSGPWLIRHPRALRLLFRLRPALRPTLVYGVDGQLLEVR